MALEESQLIEMMQAIDTDSSGLVDFDEFFTWYVSTVMSQGLY